MSNKEKTVRLTTDVWSSYSRDDLRAGRHEGEKALVWRQS
jgi:hypothetical protein